MIHMMNKAYRPNAHLLVTLMHYNINITYYIIVIIITVELILFAILTMSTDFAIYLCVISWNYVIRL